jgi:hypothetical protein
MLKRPHPASRIPHPGGLLLLFCLAGGTAEAQSAPPARADVTATIGWLGLDTGQRQFGDDEWDGTFVGALSAGWYWTDHLKTEVEAGAVSEAEGFGSVSTRTEGQFSTRYRRSTVQRNAIGISQQYQFGRNAWFHPHVAAGVSIAFDTRLDHYDPTYGFDPVSRTSSIIEPGRTEGPMRTTTVRPFLAGGFKAYVTPRVFVRSDVRAGVGTRGVARGIDELLARIGMGIDF